MILSSYMSDKMIQEIESQLKIKESALESVLSQIKPDIFNSVTRNFQNFESKIKKTVEIIRVKIDRWI